MVNYQWVAASPSPFILQTNNEALIFEKTLSVTFQKVSFVV